MKFLIILIMFLIIPCASAGYVTTFDSSGIGDKLIAGSVYETTSTFDCGDTNLCVNMTVEHPEILVDEWFVRMYLDGTDLDCTETNAGIFSSCFDVNAGSHDFMIEFTTLPNILPGEYVVTVYYPDTIVTTGEEGDVEEEEENHNYAHRLWREKWKTPSPTSTTHLGEETGATPTPTPIPTSTPTEEPTFIEPVPTEEETTPYAWWFLIAAIVMAIVLLIAIYILRNWQKT